MVEQPSKTIYIGGQNGVDANGQVGGPTLKEQATQAFRNLAMILASEGARLANIVHWRIRRVGPDVVRGWRGRLPGGVEPCRSAAGGILGAVVAFLLFGWASRRIEGRLPTRVVVKILLGVTLFFWWAPTLFSDSGWRGTTRTSRMWLAPDVGLARPADILAAVPHRLCGWPPSAGR